MMSVFAINDKNNQPTRMNLETALGEKLAPLCSDLFLFAVKTVGGMKDVHANWIYDEFFGAWNLVVDYKDTSLFTVYGQADAFVCHFYYKNVTAASAAGHEAWIKVCDKASLQQACEAIAYLAR